MAGLDFPSRCEGVDELGTALLGWLAAAEGDDRLGGSHAQVITTVDVGGEPCLLRGGSTRDGVAGFLGALVTGAALWVVPSTRAVVHRVGAGVPPQRIRGFYVYTASEHPRIRQLTAGRTTSAPIRDWTAEFNRVAEHVSRLVDRPLAGRALTHQEWAEVAAVWDPLDIPGSEERLREGPFDGSIPGASGMWERTPLLARAQFEQGRWAEALATLEPVIEMGVPWWLLQVRFLARGYLALALYEPMVALQEFTQSLRAPDDGLWDCGFLLRALHELAVLEVPDALGYPAPADRARLALTAEERLMVHGGSHYTIAAAEQLRDIAAGAAPTQRIVGATTVPLMAPGPAAL